MVKTWVRAVLAIVGAALLTFWLVPVALAAQVTGEGVVAGIDAELLTLSAMIGFFMPPIIATINRKDWTSQAKGICAFVVCLAAAFGTAWWQDAINRNDLRTTILVIFSTAIFTYGRWWKPSGIADSIERNT